MSQHLFNCAIFTNRIHLCIFVLTTEINCATMFSVTRQLLILENQRGGDRMDEMTTPELNQFLEAIAELIEAKANTVSEAAEIVRQKKIPA